MKMNLKISKEQHEYLLNFKVEEHVMGSKLYGVETEESDTDILCIYRNLPTEGLKPERYLPNFHQFQYDSEEDNTQYIWTTEEQFFKNLFSGDNPINVDLVLLTDIFPEVFKDINRVHFCRSYKILKSFLGFAKRDVAKNDRRKLFHAGRCLVTALHIHEPDTTDIEAFRGILLGSIQGLKRHLDPLKLSGLVKARTELGRGIKEFREDINKELNEGTLPMYPIRNIAPGDVEQELISMLFQSNNIKEFKYD